MLYYFAVKDNLRAMIVLGAALAPTLLFALVSDDEAEALARSVLGRMTLEEKTMMTGGSGTMTLAALPRIGISREWTFADSSSTVRAKMSRWDWSYCGTNDEATVLASLSGLASTWNVDLARRHGEVLGEEARVVLPRQILGSSIWNRVKCISRAQTTTPMGLDSETRRIYRTRGQEEVTK